MFVSVNTGTLFCARQAVEVKFQIWNKLRKKMARSDDRVAVCFVCVCACTVALAVSFVRPFIFRPGKASSEPAMVY